MSMNSFTTPEHCILGPQNEPHRLLKSIDQLQNGPLAFVGSVKALAEADPYRAGRPSGLGSYSA